IGSAARRDCGAGCGRNDIERISFARLDAGGKISFDGIKHVISSSGSLKTSTFSGAGCATCLRVEAGIGAGICGRSLLRKLRRDAGARSETMPVERSVVPNLLL